MIKFGIQVNGMKNEPLEHVAKWASEHGIQTFELPAGPGASHVNVNKVLSGDAASVTKPCKNHDIEIASLTYCTNHLAPETRDGANSHMRKVIEAAQQLEAPIVSCFVGGTGSGNIWSEMGLFEEHFLPLVDHAGDHGIKLAIENCPAGGKNIGRSPYYWNEIFEASEHSKWLGLEFDPSHLVWLHIDWKKALDDYLGKDKVFIFHAKDTIIYEDILADRGVLDLGWWEFKIPGLGAIDWSDFASIVKKHGFAGSINIEHEDSAYRSSDEKMQEGWLMGLKTLKNAWK